MPVFIWCDGWDDGEEEMSVALRAYLFGIFVGLICGGVIGLLAWVINK